jgi:single-stranded DNA-binding protein
MISVYLTGRLTRDPELRHVQAAAPSGDRLDVCQVRVAARNRRGDTVYLDVAEWGAAGRAAASRLRKGSRIAFSGDLRLNEIVGENGTRQYVSGVGHIEFLDGRPASDQPQPDPHAVGAGAAAAADDDIPF